MDVYEKSLELHRNAQGKIRVESKVELARRRRPVAGIFPRRSSAMPRDSEGL